MKNIPKTIACLSLSLLTIGAFGQLIKMPASPLKHKANGNPLGLQKMRTHAPNQYYVLYYAYEDSVLSTGLGTYYDGYYLNNMNSRYNLNDTGVDVNGVATNPWLFTAASVAFDTLLDANTFLTTPDSDVTNMTVDSIFVVFGQENTSGTMDTIVFQVNGISAGLPNTTVLWSDTIFTDTSISPNNSWDYVVTYNGAPNLTLPAGVTKFSVSVQYFGSKLDTMGFLYGFPYFNCTPSGGSSQEYADTSLIGVYPISTMYPVRANSFTTGYAYYVGEPGITLPNAAYGDGFYYECNSTTDGILYWQDIVMSALVSFNSDAGIQNIATSGFSVGQNYPNPFNQETQITYSLTKSSNVTFSVYDLTGREIMTNDYNTVAPGNYTINLNANTFSPGIYFYTFNVGGSKVTKKMVITE